MAQRYLRKTKRTNYAKMNSVGMDEDQLEDGQIEDSPMRINASDDDLGMSSNTSTFMAGIGQGPGMDEDDAETLLDYEDDVDEQEVDPEPVEGAVGGEEDLASDEVWEKHQKKLQDERERRELLKRRLERQKNLALAEFEAEQEKDELKQMERDISELNQKRLVDTLNKVSRGRGSRRAVQSKKRQMKTSVSFQ